jgi:hypothetical protein
MSRQRPRTSTIVDSFNLIDLLTYALGGADRNLTRCLPNDPGFCHRAAMPVILRGAARSAVGPLIFVNNTSCGANILVAHKMEEASMSDGLIVLITVLVLLVAFAVAFIWTNLRARNGMQKRPRHSKHRPF